MHASAAYSLMALERSQRQSFRVESPEPIAHSIANSLQCLESTNPTLSISYHILSLFIPKEILVAEFAQK